jgi:polyferredoxin
MSTPSAQQLPNHPAPGVEVVIDEGRYSRRRAWVLVAIHVLIGLHIAHWYVAGRTLAPLELNEVMYTLELGIVTAGFLLMVVATVSVLVFGRFFCSWACHILALQDLSAWLLGKLGIRAKQVRSRSLRIAPFVASFYMFVWPSLVRVLDGRDAARLHVTGTDSQWASFITDDFWRNLPGPWIATATFLVCGFAIVYLLGSRGFCANACPYGAVFNLLDRVAPGRIVAKGDCSSCGRCTAVCQSGVWIHEEILRYGRIVDPNCLKDMDCVAACPEQSLGFGFTKPAIGRKPKPKSPAARDRVHHLTIGEDLLAAGVILVSLLAYRGLYGLVPFLMSLGIGVCLAWLAVLGLRVAVRRDTSLRGRALVRNRKCTRAGKLLLAAFAVLAALTLHSGAIRFHEYRGSRTFERAQVAVASRDVAAIRDAVPRAIADFEFCMAWGLHTPLDLHRRLASLHSVGPTPDRARAHFQIIVASTPDDLEAQLRLAYLELASGNAKEAGTRLLEIDSAMTATARNPRAASLADPLRKAHAKVADALDRLGDPTASHHRTRARQP